MVSQNLLEKIIIYFSFGYVIAFSFISLFSQNGEFIYYSLLVIISASVALLVHSKVHFYPIVLLALSILGLLHLAGGNIWIGQTRLYDYYVLTNILRFDNIVHAFGSGIAVMLAYTILQPVLKIDFEQNRKFYFATLLIAIGMGIGALNEIIEYFAVLYFHAREGVGGYDNTLHDLLYNVVGSTLMAVILVTTQVRLTLQPKRLQ